MAKSTKSVVTLDGVTAVEMRELISSKRATVETVVAYLREKEERVGLRYPARELLKELTAKPGKPAPAKPVETKPAPAKPVAKPVAPVAKADDLAEIIGKAVAGALAPVIARLDAVEAKLNASPAPAKPVAKPEPVVAAKPAPAKPVAKPAPAKPAPVKGKLAKLPAEEDVRAAMEGMTVGELRARAKEFEVPLPKAGSKDAIIDAMIADALANGLIVAAAPVKPGKPNLKVVRATEVTF